MQPKELIKKTEKDLRDVFEKIDDIRDFNQEKVLRAFVDNKVAPEHFYTVSGYGHDDIGREVLDNVFAPVFRAAFYMKKFRLLTKWILILSD